MALLVLAADQVKDIRQTQVPATSGQPAFQAIFQHQSHSSRDKFQGWSDLVTAAVRWAHYQEKLALMGPLDRLQQAKEIQRLCVRVGGWRGAPSVGT